MVLDPQLLVEISKCVIVELPSIVRDEGSRDSEAANDASPNEATDILFCDSGQWLGLDPFDEVVDPYDEELKLSYSDEEGPNSIQSPLGERPRGTHPCKFLSQSLYDVAKTLALVTRLFLGLASFCIVGQ